MKRAFAMLLLAAALSGCRKEHKILNCEACIERDGQLFCGRTQTDQFKQKVAVTEEQGKLGAGQAACVEFAARKGGGYAGPPYHKALEECRTTVTMKDLVRTRCDETVVQLPWDPKDGGL